MNLPLGLGHVETNRLKTRNDVISLSKSWAKRYIKTINETTVEAAIETEADLRSRVAKKLHQGLRTVSAQAWGKTEELLAKEVIRHQLNPDDIDPWAIAGDVYHIYDQAFDSYAKSVTPERFAVNIAPALGDIRAKFTAEDPRVIGFVSMQFHYTGQLLLQLAATLVKDDHQAILSQYFKAIDDHLYMPLQRAYEAAGNYAYGAGELNIVQCLLPQSSAIAQRVVQQVLYAFPDHECYSGPLNSSTVMRSSLRDAEMFQTYIWVCLLEDNVSVVQQELFPLCVMLYPTFNVKWQIVRYMLILLEREFVKLLAPAEFAQCASFFDALKSMFSPEVVDRITNDTLQ